jgi:hypothetical protein
MPIVMPAVPATTMIMPPAAPMVANWHNTTGSTHYQPHQNHQQYNSPLHFQPFPAIPIAIYLSVYTN